MRRLQGRLTLPYYVLVVVLAISVLSPPLGVWVSVKISERSATEREQSETRIREETRLQSCMLFGSLLDVYEETPPSTAAGRNVERAYRDYYNGPVLRCQPERRARDEGK